MTNQEYSDYIDKKAKNSPILKDVALAFLVGGIICMIGQLITDLFMKFGVTKDDAGIITSIILIFLGAFLTSLNLYSKIGKFAGAGSIIPITGFSNSVVAPAIEYKTEGYILGLGANMFKIAGPVLVYGISSSVAVGLIYWLIKLFI
ncbi:MAG: stage V sporulation protein AC [Clostridia bacterium]|nr:stage V sporulation protein AC [Clostridia bacterium]